MQTRHYKNSFEAFVGELRFGLWTFQNPTDPHDTRISATLRTRPFLCLDILESRV